MTITSSALAGKIPDPIVRTLRKLIRRRRLVIVVRGLAAVWTVAVVSLLAVMAVDASVTLFAAWPRWLLSLSAGAITLAAAAFFLVRPLVRTFSLAGIARLIESRHPELHERISSAVELLSSTDSDEFRGSRFLIEALAKEACQDAIAVTPKREVSLAAAKPFFISSAAVLLVLGGLLAVWPKATGFLLTRAIAPYKNLANIQAQDLVVAPGDATVAAGSRVRVEVSVANPSVQKASFRQASAGADDLSQEMAALTVGSAGHSFALTLPPAESDFRYRIHAGDAVSRYYDVHVVALPTVRGIDVISNFPAYTQRPPEVRKGVDGDIKAIAGTEVTILMQSDVPLSATSLLVNGQEVAKGEVMGSAASFRTILPARLNGRWAAKLVRRENGQDFEAVTADHQIQSLPDTLPTIKIAQPTTPQLRLKPGERLPISYVATDDVGIASLEILTRIDGVEQPPIALELKGLSPHRLAVETATLDLSKMKLTGASGVTFQLRVRDTLPPDLKGPQEAFSEVFTITLDNSAQPYAVQVTMAEEVIIRQLLQQLQAELKPAKEDSAPLLNTIDKAYKDYVIAAKLAVDKGQALADVPVPAFTEAADKQVDRIRVRMDNSQKLLAELAPKVAGGVFEAMAEKITQVEDHVRWADSFASQVKVVEEPLGRKDKAERTDFHVYHALRIVTELLESLHVMSELAQKAQQLESMANQQEDLAQAKAEMDAAKDQTQPASNDKPMADWDWQKRENLLAAQLAAMARKSPQAVSAEAQRDAQQTKDLSAEARELAKQQAQLAKDSDLLTKLAELDQQRKALSAEQTQLANETKSNKDAQAQANKMTQAAGELEKGKLDKAVSSQKEALSGLEQKSKPSGPDKTATPENSAAAAMAPRQADLNRRTAELNDKVKALQKEMGDPLTRLQGEQRELARQAGELSDKTKSLAPQADESDTKAALAAKKAADQLDANEPAEAATSGMESAKHLEKLAHEISREAGKDSLTQADDKAGQKGKLADEAADLASRQKNVAQQMKALADNNAAEIAKARQKEISDKTTKLADSMKLIGQHAEELVEDPSTRQEASQAGSEVDQAKGQQHSAEANLAGHNPQGAKQNQETAASQLEKAAGALDRLGAKLAETAARKPSADQTPVAEEPSMDEAYDQTRKTARTQELTDAAIAAKLLAELSKQAMENARARGINPQATARMSPPDSQGKPSWSMDSKGGRGMKAGLSPAELEAMGINVKDWARLPGHLKDEVLQSAQDNVPEEYRQLVKHYFQEIARRGGTKEAGTRD